MRTRTVLLAVCATLVLTSLPGTARAADDPPDDPLVFAPRGLTQDRFAPVSAPQWVDVRAHDGVMLAARVYRPDTSSDPEWKTPVILVHSPYYGAQATPGSRSLDLVTRFTPKGYTVVLSSVRGTGDSGGCLEQDGPNQAKDFKTLVEHFAAQPWSNGKVASYGKSYDAETQNAGAVLRPEGLETMVTVAGISSLYDVGYFDGVPLTLAGLAATAVYASTGPAVVPTERTRYTHRAVCYPEVYANSLELSGDESPFWAERNFRYGVENIDASVLYVHGLNDFTVNPLAIDGWYDELPTFKRAILGQWGHFYPYDAPAQFARDDWYDTVHAWLDHELLGLDSGVAAWPPVQVQDETNRWSAARSFRGIADEEIVPLGTAALGDPGAAGATRGFAERTAVTWDGPVLPDGLRLSGQAYLDATITLDRPDAHLAFLLQEVDADGTVRTLTRGYRSVQHQEDPNRGHEITPGHPVPYRVRSYPFDKTLSPGSRLRVSLSGSDGTTIHPAGNAFTGSVAVDGRSVVRLPVVRRECGVVVDTRAGSPPAPADCVDQELPRPAPRTPLDAARGHRATARVIASSTDTIGGVSAMRESGYLRVRDGVELAYELVRPADGNAHPVLFTYDGYDAGRNPDPGFAARYLPKGYAVLGVNVRGSGCSGGVFDFFQPSEGPDGFEAVQWVARQPWSNGRVGMIGKSFPGITQLFVAATRPPNLAAIAPGHYFVDAYRDVAYPGGILNYAFAGGWSMVQPTYALQNLPENIAAQDSTCLENLQKHVRNLRTHPFIQAQEHPLDDPFIQNRSPRRLLDRIEVPVFSALSWQDEQLGSRQSHALTAFERAGVPYRAVVSNGDHNMYRRGPQLAELDRFLEAHVEGRAVLRDGTPREDYLAEDPVAVFWEQSTGQPRWRSTIEAWGDHAAPMRLFLGPGEGLEPQPTGTGSDAYAHTVVGSQGIGNPRAGHSSFPDVSMWDKYAPPRGAALAYTSEPLGEDAVLLGAGSADLWITSTAPNVDLQVTLTEVRPDGQEVYVQQGWLRTRQRATDPHRSSALLPFHTHSSEDVQPLSDSQPALARVELLPFGHAVRAGSRLRLWIEAPTILPQLWGFALDPTPAQVTVWRDAGHRSSVALPLTDLEIPDASRAHPACGAVLRQPCRPDPRAD